MAPTYKLIFSEKSGLTSKRTEYAPGEEVAVWYLCMASDTSYTFDADAPDAKQVWENGRVGVRFTMPAHDVAVSVGIQSYMMNPDPGPMGMGMFLGMGMGMTMPAADPHWKCISCGAALNLGKFCTNCGTKKTEA